MKRILFLATIILASITYVNAQCSGPNAGPDITICGNAVVGLGGIIDTGTVSVWIGGLGTFTPNRNDPKADYDPDPSEVGSVVTLILATSGGGCNPDQDTIDITVITTPHLVNPTPFVYNVCPSATVDLSTINIIDTNNSIGTITYEDVQFNPLPSSIVSTGGIYYFRKTTNSQPSCDHFVSVAIIIDPCVGCSNPPSLTSTSNDVTCNGNADGDIDINLSGGVPPVAYAWSNGATTQDLSGLSGGTYTVTVTDNENCTAEQTVVIYEPPAVSVSISTADPTTFCQGSGAQLESSFTPGNVTKQWLKSGIPIPGATANTYFAKQNGNHRLSVVDTNGCSANSNIILITKNSRPPASLVANGAIPICVGDSVQLTANIGNYTYQWIRNSKLQSGATSTTFYAKSAGNHKVLVTDANGCFRTSNKISVTRYPRVQANVNPSGTVVICPPDSIQLSAVVTVGTSPYSYQWYRYNTSQSGETSVDYYADKFGGYKVIVTDNHGCTDKTSSTVVQEVCRLANGDTYTLNDNLQVSAYPNPFNNNVTIALDNFSEDRIKIIVRDMIGRVVYHSEENPEFEYQLNTSEYTSGIYFIEVHQNSDIQRVKIMKHK